MGNGMPFIMRIWPARELRADFPEEVTCALRSEG